MLTNSPEKYTNAIVNAIVNNELVKSSVLKGFNKSMRKKNICNWKNPKHTPYPDN